MGFSEKQVQALRRSLNSRHVRTREANGRELSYIEGWYVISEANRIFGFDAWNRETVDSRCVLARENRGSFLAVYIAKVRVTVHADGATIVREGHGSAEGQGTSPGEVHDIALKAAETDATKRALSTFGKPFGLELYRKDKAPRLHNQATLQPFSAGPRLGSHPDDTTPIPRPSHYYGRRHQNSMTELLRRDQAETECCGRANLGASAITFGQNRQKPTHYRRTQAPTRQGAPQIRRLPTVSHLRTAAIRPASSTLCPAAGAWS